MERLHALLGLRADVSLETLILNEEEGVYFGDRYDFVRIVGAGAFGVVAHVIKKAVRGQDNFDESPHRALKIICKPNIPSQEYQLIRNEALILQQL